MKFSNDQVNVLIVFIVILFKTKMIFLAKYTHKPRALETEARGSRIQIKSQLCKSEANMGHIGRP